MYYRKTVNPLMGTGNYSATPNNLKLVWPVLAVPNVTAHPSMASVPITVLLYNGPLLYDFNVLIKGLTCPWNFDNWRAVSVSYSTCSGARREVWYVWLYLQKADMAASPILITDARRQVVDFSTPFMTTQATLLLRRPPPGAELSVKDLADLVSQSEIQYGTLRKGFIPRNFRSTNDTLLTIVWRNMRRSVTIATSTAHV